MNFRKMLANSPERFWDFSILLIFGIYSVILCVILIPVAIVHTVGMGVATLVFLLLILFAFYYLKFIGFVIDMATPYGRLCLFKKGDIVKHYDSGPCLVTKSDSQHMWVSSDLSGNSDGWITDANGWTFYESTWLERLLK